MGIGLSIVFSGLCALVTDAGNRAGQVVLVDPPGLGEVGGVSLPAHAPTLVLDLGSLVNPETARPDHVVADDGASSWPEPPRDPEDAASWRDVRFLADMTSIAGDGRIDPELLKNAAGTLPRGVAARIHLDTGLVEAGLPSRKEYRDDVFEFAATANRGALRQALTDTMRWRLEKRADAVVVEIAPVSGGPVRRLILKPTEAEHRLFVGNLPAHDSRGHDQHVMTDETFAALHFGVYYELLHDIPDSRGMPRLLTPHERRSAGGWMGPICPPARFRTH